VSESAPFHLEGRKAEAGGGLVGALYVSDWVRLEYLKRLAYYGTLDPSAADVVLNTT
jgi:hypothetical protein